MVRILANPFALSPSLCSTGVCSPEFPLRRAPWRTTFPALRTLVEVSIGLLITHATSPEFPLPRTVPGVPILATPATPAAARRRTSSPAPPSVEPSRRSARRAICLSAAEPSRQPSREPTPELPRPTARRRIKIQRTRSNLTRVNPNIPVNPCTFCKRAPKILENQPAVLCS